MSIKIVTVVVARPQFIKAAAASNAAIVTAATQMIRCSCAAKT